MTKRIKISEDISLTQLCDRCGSKKRISKTWKEKIPTFDGQIRIVKYTELVCINSTCQAAFDKQMKDEAKKLKDAKEKREEIALERKKEALKNPRNSKKIVKGLKRK